ncbi:hypothetical protein GIB67_029099 [Kingdonia uniflora]|uniref:non-specific serine/threonine protein kinase n=1 Tax=Kingdonia uniflora TaxID=39325 RepID=A0A7J7N720_9MAGN|nr:hypothetical protein GIB67_029099 [Kingdonia uniflora]
MNSQRASSSSSSTYTLRELARLPIEFNYGDLKKATNNFRDMLGSGGSGSVFKGKLDDGTPVAVKRVERAEYGERQFEAEISSIASVQHINLVRLRGYCSHMTKTREDFFIVYDLFRKGSLENWIFLGKDEGQSGQCLPWKLRYRVAIDIAKALSYLHHDCRPRILHLDIKPENILLDDDFRAVVSDFGLSKLMTKDESKVYTIIRGTNGYRAPEWLSGHGISEKCDIFSYGQVLLDLFFGQRYVCLDEDGNDIYTNNGNSVLEQRAFHAFMWEKLTQKELLELIDKRLMQDVKVNEKEASSLVNAALCCLKEDPEKRLGDMRQVVDMLEVRNLHGIRSFEQHVENHNEHINLGKPTERLPKFHYKDLKKATNNFRDKLGGGSSDLVFKGKLDDGTPVAVKSVKRRIHGEQEFQEVISTIASVDHRHVLCCRGYCSHITETGRALFIVYDLFSKGSLDNWIFPQMDSHNGGCLSWKSRYRVAIEIAKALVYLHHDCQWIFHPDIKPENILLDDNFQVVLSDFGLSRFLNDDESRVHTTFRGTKGNYEKSDIFTYGKLLLELFFGKHFLEDYDVYTNDGKSQKEQRTFHALMWKKLRKRKVMELIDKRVMADGEVDDREARSLIYVALWCLDEDPKKRAGDMRHVVDMLEIRKLGEIGAFSMTGILSIFKCVFPFNEYIDQKKFAKLPREFRHKELIIATNNFEDNLGSGGSGSVFKGILNDGTLVAVKRVEGKIYGEHEFEQHISSIASVQHSHLVRLRGYCSWASASLIVTNFFPKGSLDNWIFPRRGGQNSPCLSWKLRCRIATDVAKALVYLHYGCHPPILHLAIKPENILLDDDFRAVVSDFGLSKLIHQGMNKHLIRRRMREYAPPEMLLDDTQYDITKKCDVYSFGVLLLDIFFNIGNLGKERSFLTIHHSFLEKFKIGAVMELIDRRLTGDVDVNLSSVWAIAEAAQLCLLQEPGNRLNMQQVLELIEPVRNAFA